MDKTVALEATNVAICRIVHSGPTAFRNHAATSGGSVFVMLAS
jgi:hypothetical protein